MFAIHHNISNKEKVVTVCKNYLTEHGYIICFLHDENGIKTEVTIQNKDIINIEDLD